MDAKRQAATNIVQRFSEASFQAYWVRGCMRDLVMGREPEDFDITTNATPDKVTRLYPQGLTVGDQFGVVRVAQSEENFKVATFRSDGRYPAGREQYSDCGGEHACELLFAVRSVEK
jgi:tRNA nucleotidyltransferase/poly(A) polymerase